jgi:hypothetical protein
LIDAERARRRALRHRNELQRGISRAMYASSSRTRDSTPAWNFCKPSSCAITFSRPGVTPAPLARAHHALVLCLSPFEREPHDLRRERTQTLIEAPDRHRVRYAEPELQHLHANRERALRRRLAQDLRPGAHDLWVERREAIARDENDDLTLGEVAGTMLRRACAGDDSVHPHQQERGRSSRDREQKRSAIHGRDAAMPE